ncbi:hypothetical protein JAAARDRAFT_66445 [Jaapia argillacea MUCL 33604]|uniref:Zn(2)-C6 fungal-type domain-containing protein n=1 Tax=Jaapia argillacea MUCL 33604 TaxID=933084 RepID=A0A067Q9I0_9AGAM|nr:hypothetical protein JAAARDRAFT_66445 [Jaapia argillacea MUCL 33604]
MMSDSCPSPSQFKGEVMDFEFALDIDHRKKRRNRATQSCLNCHTSKRKCDRKRPCQRCIQLGLTGLCVYEIDDPAARDDPTIDETTHLRNRIAELESLVRELRGKPHPRWADPNFRDGDPSDKWHSRSNKRGQHAKVRTPNERDDPLAAISTMVPVKTEPIDLTPEVPPASLFQISPTPSPPSSYRQFPSPTSSGPYSHDSRHSYRRAEHRGEMDYRSSSGSLYHLPGCDSDRVPTSLTASHQPSLMQPFCGCLTNPAAAHSLISFSQQLKRTVDYVGQFPEHTSSEAQCVIYQRMRELNDLLSGNHLGNAPAPTYGSLPTPTDSNVMSQLPTSVGSLMQEWHSMSAGGYSSPPSYSYMPSSERGYDKGSYNHVT